MLSTLVSKTLQGLPGDTDSDDDAHPASHNMQKRRRSSLSLGPFNAGKEKSDNTVLGSALAKLEQKVDAEFDDVSSFIPVTLCDLRSVRDPLAADTSSRVFSSVHSTLDKMCDSLGLKVPADDPHESDPRVSGLQTSSPKKTPTKHPDLAGPSAIGESSPTLDGFLHTTPTKPPDRRASLPIRPPDRQKRFSLADGKTSWEMRRASLPPIAMTKVQASSNNTELSSPASLQVTGVSSRRASVGEASSPACRKDSKLSSASPRFRRASIS